MSNITIFKDSTAVAIPAERQSVLGARISSAMGGYNRIATNTNGTFRRIVNGEQVGKAIRGEFNAIVVDMLEKPGREFYAQAYDPDAKGTMPDCWSNLSDKPEASVPHQQSPNCVGCPQDIEGSGTNGRGKACRFKRKVALLLEGDASGKVYQFNIPAKSLFGKGNGVTHPFESYGRFLVSNNTAPDLVVTTIAYNLDAETMELTFTPSRPITDEEYELVVATQSNPATARLVRLVAAEADGVAKAKPPTPEAAAEKEAAPAPKAKAKATATVWDDTDTDEEDVETPKAKAKPKVAPKAVPAPVQSDLAAVLGAWADDEDEEDD